MAFPHLSTQFTLLVVVIVENVFIVSQLNMKITKGG
nr:MAG TPA: hypothetical protein [Caudoviricetes sp.]